jgi:hypothetical protein
MTDQMEKSKPQIAYIKKMIKPFRKADRLFALVSIYHYSQEEAEKIVSEMD